MGMQVRKSWLTLRVIGVLLIVTYSSMSQLNYRFFMENFMTWILLANQYREIMLEIKLQNKYQNLSTLQAILSHTTEVIWK
jgi:hypothetical protein